MFTRLYAAAGGQRSAPVLAVWNVYQGVASCIDHRASSVVRACTPEEGALRSGMSGGMRWGVASRGREGSDNWKSTTTT